MPAGTKYAGRRIERRRVRIDLAVALEVDDLLQVDHADDVVERALVRGKPRVVRRGELLG